jgi:radical SAM protein with 4Fe4S-binding SPASM domain
MSQEHIKYPKVPLFNWLEIETTGSCNRTCSTCLRQTYINKNWPGHKDRFPITSKIGEGKKMPIGVFKHIIDQCADFGFTGTVNLQHYNEPLLDDRLEVLASYVKCKIGGRLVACTNMDLITEERAKYLDGIFDSFQVALYMSPEKQLKRINWLSTLFKKTELQYTGGGHVTTHYSPRVEEREKLIEEFQHSPCTDYNHMLIIGYDGTVLHCCDDYAGHFGLGNATETNIKDIWESQVHRKLVHDLSLPNGRLKYLHCTSCPKNGHH